MVVSLACRPRGVLAKRRPTRQLRVGSVGVGSDFPVSVRSMTTTVTADIHFQPKYVFAAIEAG